MDCKIRVMVETDRACVLEMMRVFYASPAVLSNGSEEIFNKDIDACVSECPYAEGFMLQGDGEVQGYAMIARGFSTEFGKPCIWVEDLYIRQEYRGMGIGSRFFEYMEERYPGVIMRLEVEEENTRAVKVYKKSGFEVLPYMEMKKEV